MKTFKKLVYFFCFFGSLSASNSLLAQVGVGTSSPTAGTKFEIVGAGTNSATTALRVRNSSSSTPLLMVRDDGNVGIGTTTPSAGLEIVTDGSQLNALRVSASQAYNSSPDAGIGFRIKYNTAGAYTSGAVISGIKENATNDDQSGSLRFLTNSSGSIGERMRIASDGKVGIGTTNPSFKFCVQSSGTGTNTFSGMFSDNSTNGNALGISNATGVSSIYSTYLGTAINSDLAFQTTTSTGTQSEKMRITSGGNVGIGTDSPLQKLHVNSTTGDGVYISSFLTTTGEINTGANIQFGIHNGSGVQDAGSIKVLKENETIGNSATYMSFATRVAAGSVTETLRITSGGNVGIGTTSPTYPLTVASNSSTQCIRLAGRSSDGGANVSFTNNAQSVEYGYMNTYADYFQIGRPNGVYIYMTNQNVGIGTSTPIYKLDVSGDIRGTTVYAGSTLLTSDARLKNVLQSWDNEDQIDFVQFRWKNGSDTSNHFGYLAQDVQKVLPDAVHTDHEGMMSVNYDEVHSFKISNLEQKNSQQEQRIKELENTVEELKKLIKKKRFRK